MTYDINTISMQAKDLTGETPVKKNHHALRVGCGKFRNLT
jgi:hypothetical protein